MKIKQIILALLVVTAFSSFTGKKNSSTLWQSKPLAIDGNNNDWPANLSINKKSGWRYGVSNDSRFLYVMLEVPRKTDQQKILITGLTLSIDTLGKNRKDWALTYPIVKMHRPRQKMNRTRRGHRPRPLRVWNKETFLQLNSYFSEDKQMASLQDFSEGSPARIPAYSLSTIAVRIQFDTTGMMIYEARIPLSRLFSHPSLSVTKKQLFSYTIETGYIDMMSHRRPSSGQGNFHGGGRGGMNPGGSGNAQRMEAMRSMAVSTKIKVKKIKLSNDNK